MKNMKTINVSLPEELYQKISRLAEEIDRTRTGYIRQIIRFYLREIENDPSKKLR